MFWRGFLAAQEPHGIKLTDKMEHSTLPMDYVGVKSFPITDAERGAGW